MSPFHHSHLKYRCDIDGLRTIAVLSVVIFHAFPKSMKGGFVGVDMFFVISGYLISTIIFDKLDKGTFSFTDFYARRIKRIFPALILVLISCFAFGWFVLLADEYKQLGKHIAGSAVFFSNFVFWKESGYFDNAADTKPLLHLWSLGVEEQFYIVWPILLWFAHKRNFNLLSIGIFVTIISFYLNIKQVKTDVVADFYSPQTRFWELMLGSVLAWLTLYKPGFSAISKKKSDNFFDKISLASAISIFALLLIIYAFCKIDKSIGFPGEWALIPVLGTALVIFSGPKAWANRVILSNKLAIWFSLISFPLYLWHWPLLSFSRIVEGEVPSRNIRITAIFLSIFFAWLTYQFIERPIRWGKHSKIKVTVLVFLMAAVGCIGYNTYTRDGLVYRFNKLATNEKQIILKIVDAWKFRGYPIPAGAFTDPEYGFLRIGRNESYKILFVGDSHSQQYWNSVGKLIASSNMVSKPTVMFHDLGFPSDLSDKLISDPSVKVVVFSYYWAYKYGSDKVNQAIRCCANGKDGSVGPSGSGIIPHYSTKEMDFIDDKFLSISLKLKSFNKKVFFVLDNPFGEELDPHQMLSRSWRGFTLTHRLPLSKDVAIERSQPVRYRLLNIAKKSQAEVIDPVQFLCKKNICSIFSDDGNLLYKDYDHLSLYSSKFMSSYLAPIFNYQSADFSE